MRVFLDTNVILEFFIEREDVLTAAQLFNRLKDEKAAGSWSTLQTCKRKKRQNVT